MAASNRVALQFVYVGMASDVFGGGHMKRFATVSVLLCTLLSPVCAAQYVATSLYPWAKASGISNSGVIVGRGPGIRDTDGTLTQLTVPALTPAGNANAVNDSGRAVGFYFNQYGSYRIAAYWDGATRHDLSVPPTSGELFGVNSSGAMCGTVGSTPVAFTASGTRITLAGSGGVTTGGARDISDAGLVVGYLGSQIATWAADGTVQYVGPAGQANAINNSGLVGGKSDGSPFLWTLGGEFRTLAVGTGYAGGEVDGLNPIAHPRGRQHCALLRFYKIYI
jgi:hypothetical protein